MSKPTNIQVIGNELAILWDDGIESYVTVPVLRAASPSAETAGERDIFGQQYGGETGKDYSAVEILDWQFVGNYAIRFRFSDGHATGLYSYELLRQLGKD